MQTRLKRTGFALLGAAWLMVPHVNGAVTNAVPWSDSFESYSNGMAITGTNGWSGAGVVTTSLSVTDPLTNYPVSGRAYPLSSATHTGVLQVTSLVSNNTESVSNGVVQVDFMAMPDWMTVQPVGDPSVKFSLCVSTNGKLTLWHRDTGVIPASNCWTELTASPVIASNAWARFTILQDLSNKLFQVRVNESAPISDAKGWTAGGAAANGSWFYMVQTNPAMAGVVAAGALAYVDDVVVNKRILSWSRTGFSESVTNNGGIDNSAPLTIGLNLDTFSGSIGDNLVSDGRVVVGGLPANLVAVAQLTSPTNLSVTLTGTAALHEAVNSTSLTFTFAGQAFSLGNAGDVGGSQTNIALTFLDTPVLAYSTNAFHEAAANDGSIDNGTPLLVTLAHGTFSGALNDDFGAAPAKLQVQHLPAGLTLEALRISSTQLQVRLLGQATASQVSDGIANLTLTFLDDAFNTVPASSVFNPSAVFSIGFDNSPVLTYGVTVFTETTPNNGALNGTTLSLTNKAFNANEGDDLVAGGKVTVTHLPAGLGLTLVRGATAQEAVLAFTGAATDHAVANNIGNLTITFLDSAFVGGNAAAVVNRALSNLQISFTDPRSLAYSANGFIELSAGLIDNRAPLTITLSGDTLTGLTGDDFVAGGKVAVANLPAGLTARVTKSSATQLSVALDGTALAHASGDSVAAVSITFQNAAFAAGNAVYVGNYEKTGMTVTFYNDTGFFNVVPYVEPFEAYTPGQLLAGTNGWSALYHADACMVTNDATITSNLLSYQKSHYLLPATGSHTQVLYVSDYIENAISSEGSKRVILDFMTFPVPLQSPPVGDANMQFSFYISTNCQLVVWHHDMTGAPVNQWLTLTGASLIDTSKWVRFTVTQDYTNNMFQIQVNEGAPISDAAGWSLPAGGTQPGPWFHMVQTNGVMAAFCMSGVGDGLLDDVTVKLQLPGSFGQGLGSIFTFR